MNKEQCNIIEGIHSQALLNIFNKQQQAKMVQDHKDKQIHTVARERYKQYITNTLHPAEVIVPDLYTPLKSVVRRHVEVEEEERHIHDVQNVVAKLKLYHAERIERLKLEKEADEQKQR